MIPQIINFVWIGPPMPEWAQQNIAEFRRLNPGYDLRIHGREVLLPQWADLYARVSARREMAADLLRYSALQQHGGWYFDVDYWPLRSVSELVSAYRLDGSRMFLTEQHGNKIRALKIANGCIGAAPGCPAWRLINEGIGRCGARPGRCDLGPVLMTRLTHEHPELFVIGRWPWFYPAAGGDALDLYHQLKAGRPPTQILAAMLDRTLGQLPFVLHLWMCGRTELPAPAMPVAGRTCD